MNLPTRILLPLIVALTATSRAQPLDVQKDGASAAPIGLAPLQVTADLWQSPLARTSASVTVLDQRSLEDSGVLHFGDVVNQIPNLTWTGGTSRPRFFQIRGIGENSQYEGEAPDSAVRFLVDDFDFTGLGGVADLFDVQQVEVLRGPQAGAFGANAAGGIVRVVTNAPTPVWTGQVETSFAEDNLRQGGLAIGGPLIASSPDKLMMRIAVQKSESDGFRHNVTLDRDTNARDELSARLRLTWNPNPVWTWNGALLFSELDNGFDEFALDNNGRLTYADQPGRDEQRAKAASLRGSFTGLEGVRFTTVTSASWVKSLYSYDDDWTAASYQGFSELHRYRSVFNQELRLDSAQTRDALGWIDRWTLGAYYSRVAETSRYTDEDPGNVRGLRTNYEAANAALFGQIAHDFSSTTRVVLGLRAEHIDLNGAGTRTRYRVSRGAFDPSASFAPSFDDTLLGGKITIEHDLDENHVTFASVTRGYKGGGINVDARISPPDDPLTYDTETMWNYEAGVRGSWFDQRLTGEFTVFYLQRHHTQVRDSAGFGGSYRFFTANGNNADVYGIEGSATFELTKDWALYGTIAQLGSSLDRFVLQNGNEGGGRRLANTPKYGYTVGTRYHHPAGWFTTAEWVGRASQYDSNNQNEERRPFHVVNARLGYVWQRWTVTVWARNLLDEEYDKRVFFFGNEDPDYIETRYEDRADPRQVGVTARFEF